MSSSPRRPLHYGDVIYLSAPGGSLGTFYSFTNLNNVLLLEKGSGVEAAQGMWCSFRVVPPYTFTDQDMLLAENSRPNKDWVKINQLEKAVALEKLDNKKRFVRSLTRAVRYHQDIQLQHESSGMFLSHTPFKTSYTEDRNFPCCLQEIPSEKTKFKVHPAIPGYISGDVVHDEDVLNLFSEPDGFIRYSDKPLEAGESFFPALPEINIGPARWGFTASVVSKIIERPELNTIAWDEVDMEDLLNPKHLLGTNVIQLLKCGTDLYYVYDEGGKETTLALKHFPKICGKHYCSRIETYWIVEHDDEDGSLNGSAIEESSRLRLKNFISGEYATFPGKSSFVRLEHALMLEEMSGVLRSGTHLKLATESGYIGHEDDKVVMKEKFDYSDTLTMREVVFDAKVDAIKLLGLKILLKKILATDSNKNSFRLTVKHHDAFTTILEESGRPLDTNSSFVDSFTDLGIVKDLVELAKTYNEAADKSLEIILCLDAICKIFNKITIASKLEGYDTAFTALITDLIVGSLTFAVKKSTEDSEDDDDKDEGDLIISPLHSFVQHSPYLLTRIPRSILDKLVARLPETDNQIEKREIIRILCRLCRCHQKTVPSNQVALMEFFFKDKIRSKTLLGHVVKDNNVLYNGTSITDISQQSELYLDLMNQLELYECLLFGRYVENGVQIIVQDNNMFTLSECVYVIKKKEIDKLIKSWYIKILIAAHIDTGFTETDIIPNMLTFQYEQNVTRARISDTTAEKPPDATASLYKTLLYELEMFLRKHGTITVKDPESIRNNLYNYNMIRLLEYMFRAGRIDHDNASKFISPLIGFLDGTCDNYSSSDSKESEQTFQKIFRFKSSKLNRPVFMIKNRALRALYYAYEKALFYYWTDIMQTVYSTVKNYDSNKDAWISQIANFVGQFDFKTSLHEVIMKTVEEEDFDILLPKEADSRESLFQLLTDKKTSIELFANTEKLVTILMDTMRYEDQGLSERALKMLIMIRSPTNRLLELLPKSEITLSNTEFNKRKEMITCVTRFLKVSKHELSLQSRLKICETLSTLEESIQDKETGVNQARQKLLFDLDTVSEVIALLCEPIMGLIIMPANKEEQEEATRTVDQLKAKGFSLLRHLITGLPDAQAVVMKHFTELIGVKSESDASSELELARVLALNEVFTANTNLCIKVGDDLLQLIFEKLLSLVNVPSIEKLLLNSDSTYRYFELLENILDLEESDQVLYKLQAGILRCMRDYWVGLNGTVVNGNGKEMTLNLLECRKLHDQEKDGLLNAGKRDWKGMYFVKALSLMSCCALGSVKSSLTICKELIPYAELKSLLQSSSWDVIYFNCLSKFFLNVYVKTRGIVRKNKLIADALEFIQIGIGFGETLFGMLLEGDTSTKLDRLRSVAFFDVRLKLGSSDDDFLLLQMLDCVFYDLLPLVAEVYGDTSTTLLDACGGAAQAQQISTLLRNLLRVTSNFLTEENFVMLISTVEAVNSYKPFQGGADLEVARNGVLWKVSAKGRSKKEEGKVVTTEVEILIKDVLDLRRERAVQNAILEKEECARINNMFQNVVSVIRKIIKSDMNDLFFTKSQELLVLGNNILGTGELEESSVSLSDVMFAAPTVTKEIVLATVRNVQNTVALTYKEEELWILMKRVFSWLKKDQLTEQFIVKQLLNSITLQIETLKLNEDKDAVVEIITRLLEAHCVEMLCILINNNTSAQPAITCLTALLQFPDVQKQMLHVCRSSDAPVFEWVWEQIQTARAGYEQFNMAHNAMGGTGSQPIIDIDTATPQMRLSVQFLGRLANKKTKLQDYLRSQENKVVTHNFLAALLNLLKTVPTYDMMNANHFKHKMREHTNMIDDVLVALVEMLSTNTKAKEYSIEMGIIESIDRLLLESKSADTELEDRLKLRINCYDVLITLLEHDQKLLDVGQKIFDAINIHELHQAVSEHLEILNSSEDESVRERSFTAVFKGYNVIKKMYQQNGGDGKHTEMSIDEIIADADVKVESVEVVWNNSLEKVYFPSTPYNFIRRKVKDEMLWGLTRKTLTDKNLDFLRWSKEMLVDMANVAWLRNVPIVNRLANIEFLWDWCVFLFALIIQVWLVFDLTDYGMVDSSVKCGMGDYDYLEEVNYTVLYSWGGNETQEVCVSRMYHAINIYIGILQLLSTLLLSITYVVTNFHRFRVPTYNLSWIYGSSSERAHTSKSAADSNTRMTVSLTSFYHVWLVIMVTCSCLGIKFYGVFFCVHLLHIITMFDLLTRVIKGATANIEQLLFVIPFALCIILMYALAHFHLERKGHDNSSMEYCDSLLQCFVTAFRYSFRNSNGGHSYKWKGMKTETDQLIRIVMDVAFWLMYSIIGLKVVTALILDGFISQKKERESALKDMQSVCTICGIKKDQFASKGIDWYHHYKVDHNMWSYINLFYYLSQNNRNSKLSALESEVLEKFYRQDPSFLPRETSLSWTRVLKEEGKRRKKIINFL